MLDSRHAVRHKVSGIVARWDGQNKCCTGYSSILCQLDRLARAGGTGTGHDWYSLQAGVVEHGTRRLHQFCALFACLSVSMYELNKDRREGGPTRWTASPAVPETTGTVPALAVTVVVLDCIAKKMFDNVFHRIDVSTYKERVFQTPCNLQCGQPPSSCSPTLPINTHRHPQPRRRSMGEACRCLGAALSSSCWMIVVDNRLVVDYFIGSIVIAASLLLLYLFTVSRPLSMCYALTEIRVSCLGLVWRGQ